MIKERAGSHKTGCSECGQWGTSKIEKKLREALIPYGAFPNSNYKIGKWKVDIYFPETRTVVEYDGAYSHSVSGRFDTDIRKSLELLNTGYRVIRVRAYNKNYPYKGLSIDNPMYLDLPFCDSKNEISDVLVEKIYRLAGTIL